MPGRRRRAGNILPTSKKLGSTLDKTGKLVIIKLDDLASSLFRPRRFASLRAAGFLFFLPDFCYNQVFSKSFSLACHESQLLAIERPCCSVGSARGIAYLRCGSTRRGARETCRFDRPWPDGRLLGIAGSIQSATAAALTDWHVRGDDLIAVYETGQPDAAQIDLFWRAARPTRRPVAWPYRSADIGAHRSARLAIRRSPRELSSRGGGG